MYRVYIPPDGNAGRIGDLQARLAPGVELLRTPSKADMVVCGRPDEGLLETCSPSILLIPFAGIPPGTLERARRFPSLRVHNLHHNARAAAETAVALMLAAARRLASADAALRRGDWSARRGTGRHLLLGGSRVLILGYGSIGRRVRRACEALEAEVSAIRRTPDSEPGVFGPDALRNRLAQTDFLVCCLPLTPETRDRIGAEELALLHDRSVVVNVGRAGVITEPALYDALESERIGAAGLDVWYRYPGDPGRTPPSGCPFHMLENVVMSPHLGGGYGIPELERLRGESIVEAIAAAARGEEPPHRVNLELGY